MLIILINLRTVTDGREMHVRLLRPTLRVFLNFLPVLAFSTGPRSCLGERFAITESICILANVVRKYEILLPDGIKLKSFEERKKTLALGPKGDGHQVTT